ncbi:MAG: hypothetical protein QNJ44_11245 [Rhodobacter sp.]|nr:hypothetical protein [Rhodobacter sp.]
MALSGAGIWALTVTPSGKTDGTPETRRLTRFDQDPWGLGAPVAANPAQESALYADIEAQGWHVGPHDLDRLTANAALYASDARKVLFENRDGTQAYFLRGDQVVEVTLYPDDDDTDYLGIAGSVARDWSFPPE